MLGWLGWVVGLFWVWVFVVVVCLGLVLSFFWVVGVGVGLCLSKTGCASKLLASGSVYVEVSLHHSSV